MGGLTVILLVVRQMQPCPFLAGIYCRKLIPVQFFVSIETSQFWKDYFITPDKQKSCRIMPRWLHNYDKS